LALVLCVGALLLPACTSLPSGAKEPKSASIALTRPALTRIGQQLASASAAHPNASGFKLLPVGIDSFLLRMEMAQAAERSLDVQYYLIKSDKTGQLLIQAMLAAADRGVRVRVLLDDAGSFGADAPIRLLAGYPNVQLRLFNPFAYRGPSELVHLAEYVMDVSRLNYRMHNKLFVVDNEIAIVGGRNLGDEYFLPAADVDFADYNVLVAGPLVGRISDSFDAFWNSTMAVPIAALNGAVPTAQELADYRQALADHVNKMRQSDAPTMPGLATGEPLKAMLAGAGNLVWAKAEVIYDSPDKASVEDGQVAGRLLRQRLGDVASQVQSELIIFSPYLVPGTGGMAFFENLRQRNVRVRILTNSLASTDVPLVHSAYQAYRVPMLDMGVDLYELRPVPGQPPAHSKLLKPSSAGLYSLHAKAFVFDRQKVFIGSMNLDPRSMHINTEFGLIIDSPELARQVADRFDEIARPSNSYMLLLAPDPPNAPQLHWRTLEAEGLVDFTQEPAVSDWARWKVHLWSMLPIDELL
jgi:putative cardiolipin synthase